MKKIGVLGSGEVGQSLASGFVKHGYDVMIGSRDETKLNEWKQNNKGKTGSFADAAAFGEILVLAVKGTAAENAAQLAGAQNLKGKTVIDTTNPIADAPPVKGVLRFFTKENESLMERLQKKFPDAHFVKCFNSVGNDLMVDPDFGGMKPTMFICGNDENAKKEVTDILDQFRWETEDMGAAEAAGTIEQLCILWCIPGFLRNDWMHAYKVLKIQNK